MGAEMHSFFSWWSDTSVEVFPKVQKLHKNFQYIGKNN